MKRNQRIAIAVVATVALLGVAGGSIAWADGSSRTARASSAESDCGGAYGMASGIQGPMDAAARYLGLNTQGLITRMCGGKSLAEIAKAQGKGAVGLRAEMHEAMRESLAADASLTKAQRTAILALMDNHLDTMMTRTHMSGMDIEDMGNGTMGGHGNGIMGGLGNEMMGGGQGNAMMGS